MVRMPNTIEADSFDLLLKADLDDALDVLEKAAPQGPRANHRYTRRWRNAKGEWEYEYATPKAKEHAQMAFGFAAEHGTPAQKDRALDVLKRVAPDTWPDHVHEANAAAQARPLPRNAPMPPAAAAGAPPPLVVRFAHGTPSPADAAASEARLMDDTRASMIRGGMRLRANAMVDKTPPEFVVERATELRSAASSLLNESIRMGVLNDEPKLAKKFSADEHQRLALAHAVVEDEFRELYARTMTMRLRPPAGMTRESVESFRAELERTYRDHAKLAAGHKAAAAAAPAANPALTPAAAVAPTPLVVAPVETAAPVVEPPAAPFGAFKAYPDGSGAEEIVTLPTGDKVFFDYVRGAVTSRRMGAPGREGLAPGDYKRKRAKDDAALKRATIAFKAKVDGLGAEWHAAHNAMYGVAPAAPAAPPPPPDPVPLVVAPVDTAAPVDRPSNFETMPEDDDDNFETMPDGRRRYVGPGAYNMGVANEAAARRAAREEGVGKTERASKVAENRAKREAEAAMEANAVRLTGEERHKALDRMGQHLHAVQDFLAGKDDLGMSSSDMLSWRRAESAARKAKILRKYRRQLVDAHGDLYFQAGLHEREPIPKGHTPASGAWTPRGGLTVKVDGYLGDKFRPWKDLLRQHGFEWNGQRGADSVDGMPAHKVASLDIPAFMEAASKIGVHVDIPEPDEATLAAQAAALEAKAAEPQRPADVPADRPVTSDQTASVIADIRARRARDTLAVTVKPDGQIGFYGADFRKKDVPGSFWHTFSNKNGVISGLMDVDSTDWSVNTHDADLAMEALQKFKDLNPKFHIVVDPKVTAAVEKARADKAEAQKPIPEVEALLADGFSLKPYQNEMVRFLDSNDGNAIIGDEMGLGKTLQSLAWVAKNNKKAIVVVPKVVRRTWIEEAHKFFPGHFNAQELRSKDLLAKKGKKKAPADGTGLSFVDELLAGTPGSAMDLSGKNLVTVNYESLEKFLPYLRAAGFDTIIVDESHRAKNPKARTTKTIQAIAKTMKHRILMSGTAVKNGKEELFTQLEMVKPGIWKSPDELKMSTHGKAWNKMRGTYLARSKRNVLKDLPEKTTTISKLYAPGAPDIGDIKEPMPPPVGANERQIAAYEEAREQWERMAPDDPLDEAFDAVERGEGRSGGGSIGEFSRVRGQLALAKADSTVDMVKEILDSSDSKVLVFTESVAAAKAIAEKLGDEAVLHYGQQSDDKREAAKKEFQREGSPKRVFVSTRPSLAVGATLTAADKVVFNDLPWTAADVRQAEDRVHRVGQKNAVNVYWNVAEGNKFDENVSAILRRKYDLSAKINEGRQLSPEEKAWMEKPVTMSEVMDRIKGKPTGPAEPKIEKSARAQLRDMTRALTKAAR